MAYPPAISDPAEAAELTAVPSEKPRKRTAAQTRTFLEQARARFQLSQEIEHDQRQRELDDIRFYNGEQWPDDVQKARTTVPRGLPAEAGTPPARPCLVINKAREPVRQVLNQERQSDLGITIVPADDFAGLTEGITENELELREGLVRRIQRTSDAAEARTWAYERSTISGRGYWGVMTRYGEGKTRDQEIYIRKFYNQNAVSLDPYRYDAPDGYKVEWGFVGSWLYWSEYKAQYPRAKDGPNRVLHRGDSNDDFRALGEECNMSASGEFPDIKWFDGKDENKRCRVVEYWYTEYDDRDLSFLSDGRDVWSDELTEVDDPLVIGSRTVTTPRVQFAKIDGAQILEETEWLGHYIPIIEVIGEALQPHDEERRFEGMIRPGRDAGYGSNVLISKLVEHIGLTPLSPLILDPESIESYGAWYRAATTRALPYLPQRTRDDQGREYREAHRPQVDPNLQPLSIGIQMFNEFIQSTMGVHDPSLGKVDPRLKSGSAIKAVISQDLHGISNYLDNHSRAIHREGMIINDLLFPIYGRPGRIAKMLNEQNKPQPVVIGQPHVLQQGKPQIVDASHPQAKTYHLTEEAKFNIAVKVTKNYDLKRDAIADFLSGLVEANPQMMSIIGDLMMKVIDVPERDQLAERFKVILDPRVLQMLAAKAQGMDIPPHVQAQLAALQKQLQDAHALVQSAAQELKSKDAEQQTKIKLAQMDTDRAVQLQTMKDATTLEAARISAGKQAVDPQAEATEEAIALAVEQAHDAHQAELDRAHELAMSQVEHQQTMQQGNQEHAQALEQSQQQAALQPPAESSQPPATGP